ncbi:MAG: heme ABC exporter ATP-binding protein CcmA [Blastocatellia bacterium]|nr:MAG: heme ABC exporter ATP-binding protein CcmA [Blastocatellia bacterium]
MTIDFDQVQLVDVSRHYGRRRAVSHISFSARRGDIVALLGPNGAGKSTLIGILATLVVPTIGRIVFEDQGTARAAATIRARIGLLAHELHLYPELSARENLTFFANLYGLNAGSIVDAALHSAGLADRADDAVSEFSRGMRQRLALERSLLHQPRLLLLDEPFTGLDERAIQTVRDRLRALAAVGAIVILATHDLDLAEGLATRVAVMRAGRLLSDESAAFGLRDRYRSVVGGT